MGINNDSELSENDTMTLELDDGSTMECIVLQIFSIGEKEYIALLPMNEDGSVDDEAQIFLYILRRGKDEDDFILDNIEDDDEFEMASDYFDEMLDEEEFDSLFE